MSSQPLRPGDPAHLGEYELLGRLGAGGMGTVFLGRSPQGRLVAVKVVRAEFIRDEEFLGRFRSEVNRARQVPPFCTAEVLGADLDSEPPYLVVEYVDGPALTDVVRENGPLSPAALHSAAVGIATALTAIHGAGVIHRDLKPGNVLFALGGLKVIDFGIARPLEATSQHTRTDQMVGTVAYMAPERFDEHPGLRLSPAADIFAWGAVVAFAATGRTPFQGDSAPATAMRILTQQPDLTGLPPTLRGIVARTLAKEPADRPTARELLDLLLATGQPAVPLPARPVPDDVVTAMAVAEPGPEHGPAGATPARSGTVFGPGGAAQPYGPGEDVATRPPRRRGRAVLAGLTAFAVLAGGGLLLAHLAASPPDDQVVQPPGAGATPAGPGSSSSRVSPSPTPAGPATILAGERRMLIHFVEIDRDLAMPYPDEVVTSGGTGKDSLFALVPMGVDYLIQSQKPTDGEPPCLGAKVIPGDSAELVATECAATKATLFTISETGRKDDKGRPTYTIYNDAHGTLQWRTRKPQVYLEFLGDAETDTTFSFVDRGPL
ncbi:protein kinase [Actinoplanes sp. NPDC048967]|uniref:serine/threonine protein kinase n=1 Tax=Actinoplanes sp. NPDC048967 TaxID=3155269 RepID=UPI0033C2FBD1